MIDGLTSAAFAVWTYSLFDLRLSWVVYNKPSILLASAATAVVASVQHIQLNSNGGSVPVANLVQ
ncbi:hypothetical protein KIN20_011785 [Parelaphostrongylus tenuis]|uniref:Uncharacterized protein n=1 Tax=Parelaphostrongylus tenuis TaxID=148309 RepID=A0AAD5QMP9_PARTN|nr:hypothetical protein KIN20_011785 [Parelaphostrongylus tenuis]